ncbi:HAMP domain-containing protein [Spirosoma sp. BT702]|uniref:histidine kinase n=1 Tax=Spirosoma profusum TaxID=2771354 RepID=A0A927AVA6_9BACT|nr:ATP-binding protein [Spirosoma profusum]MBD2705078.1 HAMP domain-containing protein [Spirosoma profusum]
MTPSLFDSEFYRLHPVTIAAMAEFTLSFLILVYFLSLRGKTRDTWLMVGYVGLALMIYLIDIGVTTSRPPLYAYFRASHAILFAIWTLFWTWCAYTYQDYPLRREAISVILIVGCVLAGLIAIRVASGLSIRNYFSFASLYYMSMGLQAWTIVVLVRRSVNASKRWDNSSGRKGNHLRTPVGQPAQSQRAFALLIAFWVGFMVCSFLISDEGSAFTYHISQLVLLLGVLVVHVTHASEITTFQVKLVALPLTTILILLGILPFLLYGTTSPESDWGVTNVEVQPKLRVFMWLIPGSALFTLVAFILFYRVGLLKPLALLVEGVQRIEEGDLQARVPVQSRDEIGFLAQSLNKMALSLQAAQEELERRVAERTTELQHSLENLRATQTQLIQREKMASLGELTAGIAHEIQNPLNFVNNFSEVSAELLSELKDELERGDLTEARAISDDLTQNLQKISQHGGRASAIVKGMLEHSRTATGERQPTNLNALADEYLRLAYQGFRAKDKLFNCELVTHFDLTLPTADVVPQEIGRVLLNLFNNAFYAVLQNQKTVRANYQPTPTVSLSTQRSESGIEIRIKDNGTGIPESIKAKIFQPFFTTKPTGEGTGLGLSLSYDIVTKGHNGSLLVESQTGQGTQFVLQLPAKS